VATLVSEVVGLTVRDRGTVSVMTGRNWIKQFTRCVGGTGGRKQYLVDHGIILIKSMIRCNITSLYFRVKITNYRRIFRTEYLVERQVRDRERGMDIRLEVHSVVE
jgi:hypothetical protein